MDRTEQLVITEDMGFVSGTSAAMKALESVVCEIAPTNIPVLLVGESGTGKDMFANRIHRLSANGGGALVRISCAAMSPEMFSAELAISSNARGNLATSVTGTVFFDEISELDPVSQRNLLCALPEGDGGGRSGTLQARVVSTTSRNLDEEMRAGRFRSELYYRLNGVCLRLPPLREHKEDIPSLTESFLTKHSGQMGRTRPTLSVQTLEKLMDYSWPGNVRELGNVIKKIVALGDERLAIAELGTVTSAPRRTEAATTHGHSLKAAARAASREAERELILKALARTRWNRKRAAQELQISYKSLLYKLKQIGFDESDVNS